MLSTFEAENRHLDKHTEPQLKKRCAYKKKKVYISLEMTENWKYPEKEKKNVRWQKNEKKRKMTENSFHKVGGRII